MTRDVIHDTKACHSYDKLRNKSYCAGELFGR